MNNLLKDVLPTLLAVVGLSACNAQTSSPKGIEVPAKAKEIETLAPIARISCDLAPSTQQQTGIRKLEILTTPRQAIPRRATKAPSGSRATSNDPISLQAVLADGRSILLPGFYSDDFIDSPPTKKTCSAFYFLSAGPYVEIRQSLGPGGNFFPNENGWWLHKQSGAIVDQAAILKINAFAVQAGPECVSTIGRGDSTEPEMRNRWCPSKDVATLEWVGKYMILDEHQHREMVRRKEPGYKTYYYFYCERNGGIAKTSEKTFATGLDRYETVSDVSVSERMDQACESWAKELTQQQPRDSLVQ